ncbi:MAG: ATP-grasp domain-containing protein [Raineya sp.]|jgi:hypothetical protein|nr:ATP-grasp domain-containing protein [Raineya sp.]
MKVYIQKVKEGHPATVNYYVAGEGFRAMGYEICDFYKGSELEGNVPEDVVVGSIDDVKAVWRNLGIAIPEEINYPKELEPFLGRKIWKSTVNTIANDPEKWNVFIKPAKASKKFTGVLVKSTKDLIGCGDQLEDTEIWCSEPVNFLAEWRCFVRYGRIMDARMYKGNWRLHFDYKVIEEAVKAYTTAPKAYAIDFGLTDKGETLLVEVNDGYSLGTYGLFYLDYAKLLATRWAEITNTIDECYYL